MKFPLSVKRARIPRSPDGTWSPLRNWRAAALGLHDNMLPVALAVAARLMSV